MHMYMHTSKHTHTHTHLHAITHTMHDTHPISHTQNTCTQKCSSFHVSPRTVHIQADKAVLNKFKCIYIVKKDKQKNKTEHNTTHQSFKPFNSSAMSLRLHNELVNFEVILCLLIFELSQEVLIISASENLSCSLFMTLPLTACSCLSGNLELYPRG